MERNTGFEPATFALATSQPGIHEASPTLHESSRLFNFIRFPGGRDRARLHESSRGFSSFMCPACARTFVSPLLRPAVECGSSRRAARALIGIRVRPLRTQRAAALQGFEQLAQVPLQNSPPGAE